MLIIADSSALIALATCQALSLLTKLYHDVKVPQSVYDEITIPRKPQAQSLSTFLTGRVAKINTAQFILATGGLGQGEIDAMSLYKSLSADYLLIDDRRARLVAEANDIRCIGALGVLLLAKQKKQITQVKPYLDALQDSPIHYSDDLLARVLHLAQE